MQSEIGLVEGTELLALEPEPFTLLVSEGCLSDREIEIVNAEMMRRGSRNRVERTYKTRYLFQEGIWVEPKENHACH